MTRKRDEDLDIDTLMAAYASGNDLDSSDARDARIVEEHLDDDDDAAAELAALREIVSEVRLAQPRPADAPPWDAMSRDIARACDEIQAEIAAKRQRSIWRRIATWTRPRYAVPVTAIAAVALALLLSRTPETSPNPTVPVLANANTSVPDSTPAKDDLETDVMDALDVRPASIDIDIYALDADELDALMATLSPSSMNVRPDRDDDDGFAVEPVLSDEDVADWLGESSDIAYASGDGFGLLDEPDLDDLVDDLNEDDIEALEQYLEEQAG